MSVVDLKELELDFRTQATFGVALASLVLLAPFAINNFVQQRFWLGVGSMIVVALVAHGAWSIRHRKYNPDFMFYALAPTVLVFLMMSYRYQGVIGALWSYPAILSFYCMLPERRAWMSNIAIILVTVPSAFMHLDTPTALRVLITLFCVSLFSAIFVRVIGRQQTMLRDQIVTDPLTGVYNRSLLKDSLSKAFDQFRSLGKPMTLLTVDLDHFKSINDTRGHDAGDTVLKEVAALLQSHVRIADSVFRMGGEEFLILLNGSGHEDGTQIAEKIRASIEECPLLVGHVVTASLGVAAAEVTDNVAEWTKRADENLYKAKSAGRNCVIG